MELFARRRYFFCEYCGTFEFLVGDTPERVRVLADLVPPVPCPVCAKPLANALLDEGYPAWHCRNCRGVLLERVAFVDVIDRRRAAATGPGVIPGPVDPRELKRSVSCPQCRQRMEVHPYYGPGNIVIDTCSGCDAVWLDSGELGQITSAPGADRGN